MAIELRPTNLLDQWNVFDDDKQIGWVASFSVLGVLKYAAGFGKRLSNIVKGGPFDSKNDAL